MPGLRAMRGARARPGQDAHGRLGSPLSGSAFAPPGPPPTPRPLLPPAPAAPSPVAAAAPLRSSRLPRSSRLFSPSWGAGGTEPGAGRRGQEEEEAEDREKEEERGQPLPHRLRAPQSLAP